MFYYVDIFNVFYSLQITITQRIVVTIGLKVSACVEKLCRPFDLELDSGPNLTDLIVDPAEVIKVSHAAWIADENRRAFDVRV
jgi:hypothetical protein